MAHHRTEIEGTWEEVETRRDEWVGKRVRLTVIPDSEIPHSEADWEPHLATLRRAWLELSPHEKGRILAADMSKSHTLHHEDPGVTPFEALVEEDPYEETP